MIKYFLFVVGRHHLASELIEVDDVDEVGVLHDDGVLVEHEDVIVGPVE